MFCRSKILETCGTQFASGNRGRPRLLSVIHHLVVREPICPASEARIQDTVRATLVSAAPLVLKPEGTKCRTHGALQRCLATVRDVQQPQNLGCCRRLVPSEDTEHTVAVREQLNAARKRDTAVLEKQI